MSKTILGFDAAFDATADATRRQVGDRLIAGFAVLLLSLQQMTAQQLVLWLTLFALGEGVLWVATAKTLRQKHPVAGRSLRLLSSSTAAAAWATIASMWWLSDAPHGGAVALAMLCGVMVYIVRGCHRSLVHMISVATPLAIAFTILPFFQPTLGAKLETMGALTLLILFTTSSALGSWRAERRLAEVTEGLIIKQREASAANLAKSEFLANMSHELRTPLNGIVAMAHMLKKAELGAKEREAAELIASSGEILETLLSDVLDTAKIEAGQLTLESTAFHAGDLVRSVAGLLRLKAEEKGVILSAEIEPCLDRHLIGDPTRIRQILTNLVSNAVKFTERGWITIRLERTADGRQCFSVTDTGVGFDPANKDRLFERFQQADGSITRKFGGTGLGLSISKDLAEMMGGALDCDGSPGEGAKFWLEVDLPAAAAEAVEDGGIPAAQAAPEELRALSILVADDHPTNRRVVELILGSAHLRVTTVENGAQAVEAVRAEAYDLVLMDMQMPVKDGLAAVREIRSRERSEHLPRLPILMLTANALPEHVEAGRRAGADGHICKPIKPEELLAGIYDQVGRNARSAELVAA